MKPAVPDHVGDPVDQSRIRTLPNALTMLRLLLVPVFAWLLVLHGGHDSKSRLAAALVFAVAAGTDLIDGELARRRHQVTTFGKVADPIADKALTGTALLLLSGLGDLPWWITILIIGREISVTLLRFRVIKLGVIPASRGGKAKTATQILAIVLYLIPVPSWLIPVRVTAIGVALVLTLVTGVDYAIRAAKLRRAAEVTA
jgi:CDP-diacylglycerol--glycerol-3-phosphate 3-phosphatidyltransferase